MHNKRDKKYNGEKTASFINGMGNTGQLHVKESNWITDSHHAQKYIQMDYRFKGQKEIGKGD